MLCGNLFTRYEFVSRPSVQSKWSSDIPGYEYIEHDCCSYRDSRQLAHLHDAEYFIISVTLCSLYASPLIFFAKCQKF
jgi:hypothetical protein